MTIPALISRQQLQAINRRTLNYALDTAEKDYFITVALALIADSPLSKLLVFKGGTALHHCHLTQNRFSEDIDFSTSVQGAMSIDMVKAMLEQHGLFEVRKEFVSSATIKIERLRYSGILAQPGAIKVEIDHMQNVVLPPRELPYNNVWGIPITLPVMDIREMCAEKLRAASQRARYRDFYDLFLIFERFEPDLADVLSLLRQKEVRRPITSEGLHENWHRAARERTAGKDPVHYSRLLADADIQQMLAQIHFAPIFPAE